MTPLKIHNCGSYALMEYFTCWKCVIFHAVTASCLCYYGDCEILYINYVQFLQFLRDFIPQAGLEEDFIYIIHKPVSNMENINNKLSWLCINKYLPELDINNIKETLLKSGVTFFNLHRMEKGYFPTSLIKFQVETNKTDLSDLTNKNIKINNRAYIIRKFTEKPRQEYRCRFYNKFTENPRQQYRYVKPHPSTRFRKETIAAEKTNIEPKKN